MIDFHTHTILSDGELIPSELARRAEFHGYKAVGIADHVDGSNVDFVVPRLAVVCRELSKAMAIEVFTGAEVTHVPPALIVPMVKRCRELGAEFVIAHGESPAEPVAPGTNSAALKAEIDILAHPGFITIEQAREAAERGIYLELSGRKGHCLANGLVARVAIKAGAKLLVGSDAHAPSDLITPGQAARIAMGSGLTEREAKAVLKNAEELFALLKGRRK